MARLLETLRRHPLFEGLPPEELTALVVECRLRTPRKGDRLFAAGEDAAAFFVVASGRVKLGRAAPGGREHVVEVIAPGEAFALMPVLDGGRYPVDATALTDAALVRIPRDAFRRLLGRHAGLHERAAREVAARLRGMRSRLEEVSTRPVQARIASHLLRAAERDAGGAATGTVVDLGATREVVAATLGTVREVLIRALSALEKDGVVALRGRRIEIRDPEALRRLASE